MLQIYGGKASSAFRCLWFMEELGVPYQIMPLDIKAGENKGEAYLKLNPNGKIPTLVDGDVVVWESAAINYYLMEKFQAVQYVGSTAKEHAEVNQWTFWAVIHLYESFRPLSLQKYRNLPDSDATTAARDVELPRFLGVLEKHLDGKEYVAINRFTLTDIAMMSTMRSAAHVGYDLAAYPNIVRWMKAMEARPAYQKVVAL